MTRHPGDLLERSPEESARLVALAALSEASGAQERLASATDPEALHDFRVAVRRLRSSFRAYRPYVESSISTKLRRRLREITTATNAARDAEVMLAWVAEQQGVLNQGGGVAWLMSRLEERREAAQAVIAGPLLERFSELAATLRARLSEFETTVHLDGRSRHPPFGRVVGELVQAHGRASRAPP